MHARLVFVGTGVSTALPVLSHVTNPRSQCSVCHSALNPLSKNRRNNVSILLNFPFPSLSLPSSSTPAPSPDPSITSPAPSPTPSPAPSTSGKSRTPVLSLPVENAERSQEDINILFDVGKTFRSSTLRTLVPLKLHHVDYLFLTHGHADAINGLDDLRDFQEYDYTTLKVKAKIQTYLSKATFKEVENRFDYIVAASKEKECKRRVAQLDFHIIEDDPAKEPQPIFIPKPPELKDQLPHQDHLLRLIPHPVYHGDNYISIGFEFGVKERIVYLSDVSKIPDTVMARIKGANPQSPSSPTEGAYPPISLLIVDALYAEESHYSHLSVLECVALAKLLRPKKTYLIGMYCDVGDHDTVNQKLKEDYLKEGVDVELAYGGLVLDVEL